MASRKTAVADNAEYVNQTSFLDGEKVKPECLVRRLRCSQCKRLASPESLYVVYIKGGKRWFVCSHCFVGYSPAHDIGVQRAQTLADIASGDI